MKKIFKSVAFLTCVGTLSLGMTACSNNDEPMPEVKPGKEEVKFTDKTFGQEAMNACQELGLALQEVDKAILSAKLTDAQEAELRKILESDVDNVIYPTYKELADNVEELQKALGDLSENQISQQNVNDACDAFKKARAQWEKSEAFLMGPASDFSIDPHIDSWPLNRTALHTYLKNPTATIDDESYLGFHALEFILFRNGQPRKVEEFKGNDTYPNFTDITGAQELKYAETVIKDLLNHVYALEVAWNPINAKRLEAVIKAGIDYQVKGKNVSYRDNMLNAGISPDKSNFAALTDAVTQVLAADEGSCFKITDEVGTAKILHPFSDGDLSYVESPYSYNSITDFQNNIRSIENVWYGNRNGKDGNAEFSFHKFFVANHPELGKKVEAAIAQAIEKIGKMPFPFVKYVSDVWNKKFEDDNDYTVKEDKKEN